MSLYSEKETSFGDLGKKRVFLKENGIEKEGRIVKKNLEDDTVAIGFLDEKGNLEKKELKWFVLPDLLKNPNFRFNDQRKQQKLKEIYNTEKVVASITNEINECNKDKENDRSYYLVNMPKDYEAQKDNGFIWCPKYTKTNSGTYPKAGLMNTFRHGDVVIILSKDNDKDRNTVVRAIGIVNLKDKGAYAFNADGVIEDLSDYNPNGIAVDCKYTELKPPLPFAKFRETVNAAKSGNPNINLSAFEENGDLKQRYINILESGVALEILRDEGAKAFRDWDNFDMLFENHSSLIVDLISRDPEYVLEPISNFNTYPENHAIAKKLAKKAKELRDAADKRRDEAKKASADKTVSDNKKKVKDEVAYYDKLYKIFNGYANGVVPYNTLMNM